MAYRERHKLHKTKVLKFLDFAKGKGYEIHDTKGLYEAFRIKKDGKFIMGHKRDRTDHITVHGDGLKLVDEFIKD